MGDVMDGTSFVGGEAGGRDRGRVGELAAIIGDDGVEDGGEGLRTGATFQTVEGTNDLLRVLCSRRKMISKRVTHFRRRGNSAAHARFFLSSGRGGVCGGAHPYVAGHTRPKKNALPTGGRRRAELAHLRFTIYDFREFARKARSSRAKAQRNFENNAGCWLESVRSCAMPL